MADLFATETLAGPWKPGSGWADVPTRDTLDDYELLSTLVPLRDHERRCEACDGPVFTWERCSWCHHHGDDPEVTVRV